MARLKGRGKNIKAVPRTSDQGRYRSQSARVKLSDKVLVSRYRRLRPNRGPALIESREHQTGLRSHLNRSRIPPDNILGRHGPPLQRSDFNHTVADFNSIDH